MQCVSCLTILSLLFILINSEDRLPCHWKTVCQVTCRQVAFVNSRLEYYNTDELLSDYCTNTLTYAKSSFPHRGLRPDFCDYLLRILRDASAWFKMGKEDIEEYDVTKNASDWKYFFKNVVKVCAESVCGDICDRSEAKQQ
ncbi:hypothetical protein Aduo_000180 [Ancylostoma duodenale]